MMAFFADESFIGPWGLFGIVVLIVVLAVIALIASIKFRIKSWGG